MWSWNVKMKRIHLRIEERNISKNKICRDLEIPRANFNRYCRDQFQRLDANLLVKLCVYFKCDIQDLMVLVDDQNYI